jgi:aminopeptidase YwaD
MAKSARAIALWIVIVAASCSPAPESSAAFDRAVEALFTKGYPQALETYFCSLGSNPALGFRWAGTTAERAVGERVAAEMRSMGLSNVRLEPVPVDVFEFETASLTVGGRALTASTLAGVRPTPAEGITAPVIYVKGGTATDFDAAGDVAGKIVLIDMKTSSWWFCLPAFEAGHRRAAGIVCTFTPDDPKYYSVDESALGSFDGQYDFAAPPWIYISRRAGDGLKAQLQAGPVTATLLLKEKVTFARDGGTAFNVVGELPGSRPAGPMVLLAAHQDAHFRAGADDTSALVNMLAVAKAMRSSGFRPESTVVFMATAGEEFGYTNAYYEWLTGSWWAAARAHPDWAGRVRAMFSLEAMGVRGAPLALRSSPELRAWTGKLAARHPEDLPFGAKAIASVSSWNDQWPFTAAGIPSVKLDTIDDAYEKLYHSDFETAASIDWDYLAKIARFLFRMIRDLDGGMLPYSLKARADDLSAALKTDDLLKAGADPAVVSRLDVAVASFGRAAAAFEARTGAVPAARIADANAVLLEIEKAVNSGLTALSPADDDATIYPHELVLRDALGLGGALAALENAVPDRAAALKALAGTYLTRLGIRFSHSVYQKHIARLDPGFDLITWGGQGHLPKPLDVVPEYRMVEGGEYASAIAGLAAKRGVLIDDLNRRLAGMAGLLERVTPRVAAVR